MPFQGIARGLGQLGQDISSGILQARETKRRWQREDIENEIRGLERLRAGIVAVQTLPNGSVRIIERDVKSPGKFKVTVLGNEEAAEWMSKFATELEKDISALPETDQKLARDTVERELKVGGPAAASKALEAYEKQSLSRARFRIVMGESEGKLRQAIQDRDGGPYLDPETHEKLSGFTPLTTAEYNRRLALQEWKNILNQRVLEGSLSPEEAERIGAYLGLPSALLPSTSRSTVTDPTGLTTTRETSTQKGVSVLPKPSPHIARARKRAVATGKVPDQPIGDWGSPVGIMAWRFMKGQGETPKGKPLQVIENFLTKHGIKIPESLALKPEIKSGLQVLHVSLYGSKEKPGLVQTLGVFDDAMSRVRLQAAWGMTQPSSLQGLFSRTFLAGVSSQLTPEERQYFKQMNRAIGDINILRAITGLPRSTQALMDRYALELPNPWLSKSKSEAEDTLALVERQIQTALKATPGVEPSDQTKSPAKTVKVRRKSDGVTGTMSEDDPGLTSGEFERIQ